MPESHAQGLQRLRIRRVAPGEDYGVLRWWRRGWLRTLHISWLRQRMPQHFVKVRGGGGSDGFCLCNTFIRIGRGAKGWKVGGLEG